MKPNSGLVLQEFSVRPQPVEPAAVPANASPASTAQELVRKRLSGPDRDLEKRLLPFRRHWPDLSWKENWRLYWLPASFENRSSTKPDPRFLQVFESLIALLNGKATLRGYTFMDSQLTYPHLIEHMMLHAIEYLPLGAMGFCPSKGPVRMPKYDEITSMDFRAAYQKLTEKKEAFRADDMFPGMPRQLHFILGDQDLARRNLMGRGGFTCYRTRLSQTEFSEIGKQILSDNTSDRLMHEIPMPVPLLDSAAFTTARAEHLAKYFQLFDLYVTESPADSGILIAATHDLDDVLTDLAEQAGYRERKRWRALWRQS